MQVRDLSKEELADFLVRALNCFDGFDKPDCDYLWWHSHGEAAPIKLMVNCNDLFWWATADSEEITPENVHIFEQCITDLLAIPRPGYEPNAHAAATLFCCRVRGMRPQTPYYKYIDKEYHELFNACGPERKPDEQG